MHFNHQLTQNVWRKPTATTLEWIKHANCTELNHEPSWCEATVRLIPLQPLFLMRTIYDHIYTVLLLRSFEILPWPCKDQRFCVPAGRWVNACEHRQFSWQCHHCPVKNTHRHDMSVTIPSNHHFTWFDRHCWTLKSLNLKIFISSYGLHVTPNNRSVQKIVSPVQQYKNIHIAV